eukprot:5853554-Pleurochrysis_carterae.AAC.1
MNAASGKKLTYDILNVAIWLHERHNFHIAVATDGTKKRGLIIGGKRKGPESVEILRKKRREASALRNRLGVTLDQRDKARAVEQGVLNGILGDSATAAGAELFAIFAMLKKVQAKQDMGHYGNEK